MQNPDNRCWFNSVLQAVGHPTPVRFALLHEGVAMCGEKMHDLDIQNKTAVKMLDLLENLTFGELSGKNFNKNFQLAADCVLVCLRPLSQYHSCALLHCY